MQATDFAFCADEPIHIPSAIQPHGCLIAADPIQETVAMVSANAADFFLRPAAELLGAPLSQWLDRAALPAAVGADGTVRFANPVQIRLAVPGGPRLFDGIVHEHDGLRIIEIENPQNDDAAAHSARSAVDPYFNLAHRITLRAEACGSVHEIADLVAAEVRAFTGFDRVMVYRFLGDDSGEVIADARTPEIESYLGLRFPASDIPAQARRLYRLNRLRQIVDAEYQPIPLIPAQNPRTGGPLDQSFCALRSVSPVHCEYLRNMGVRASFSISLMRDDRLWGLIACHHRSPKFVSYKLRATCELLGASISSQLAQVEQNVRLARRIHVTNALHEFLKDVAQADSLCDGLDRNFPRLLSIFDATGVALREGEKCRVWGRTPPLEVVRAAFDARVTAADEILATEFASEGFPHLARYPECAAGILLLRLAGASDHLMLFRGERHEVVRWAGMPHDKADPTSFEPLRPRRSFAEWRETVRGRSEEWTDPELDLARDLRSGLNLLVIRPSRRIERLNEELLGRNAELTQFAYTVTHDLKSPLVTILGWAGAAQESLTSGSAQDASDALRRVQRAADRMSRTIDQVLKLSRSGQAIEGPRAISLTEVVNGVVESLATQIAETQAQVTVQGELPTICGDSDRIYTVFENLLGNALKYAAGEIEIGGEATPPFVRVYVRDRGPGIPPEQHQAIFQLFHRLSPSHPGDGVGLALVRKIMTAHGGRAWVDSVVGAGATFWLEFPECA